MDMSGLRIQAPGALYWFNISLVFLLITSFASLASGTFPGVFIVMALAVMSFLGMRYPLISAEAILKTFRGYSVFLLSMFIMCNVMEHVFHKPTSISGALAAVMVGTVGFHLGRYARIGRFGLVNETEPETPATEIE